MNLPQNILIAVSIIAVAAGIYATRDAVRARSDVQALRREQTPLFIQLQDLKRERDIATNRVAVLSKTQTNQSELVRLRNEVARLRPLEKSGPGISEWKPDQLKNAGRTTPQSAVQTYIWAVMTTNLAQIEKSLVADQADPPSESDLSDFVEGPMNQSGYDFYAVRVISERALSPTEIQVEVQARLDIDQGVSRTWTLRKIGPEWRLVVFNRRDADGTFLGVDIGIKPPSAAQGQ